MYVQNAVAIRAHRVPRVLSEKRNQTIKKLRIAYIVYTDERRNETLCPGVYASTFFRDRDAAIGLQVVPLVLSVTRVRAFSPSTVCSRYLSLSLHA